MESVNQIFDELVGCNIGHDEPSSTVFPGLLPAAVGVSCVVSLSDFFLNSD